jgi:hypothetical protein
MPFVALCSGLLLACLGCGPARASARTGIDAGTVAALYDEVSAALAASADIRLPERVPVLLLSAGEARERRRAYSATLDDGAGITIAVDLAADFVFADGMLGRYLPDEKVLYILREVAERVAAERRTAPDDLLFAVMAHELTHAYDDQVHQAIPQPKDLLELAADGSQLPALQARMSFIEGRATWAAERACEHAGRRAFETFSMQAARDAEVLRATRGDGAAERAGKGLVNVLARVKLVQYVQGREFAKQAWTFGGEKFMAQVYAHMPLSLPELADFERFRQRWAAEEAAALEAPESAPVPQDAPASGPPAEPAPGG